MKKMILLVAMLAASAILSNCSCNPCKGIDAPSECSGSNSYTGNWY
ncbi:MAG: hypothetical protein P4L65_10535 [Legionella sp.]|nr:hypothetical protein [Legionella sp.]